MEQQDFDKTSYVIINTAIMLAMVLSLALAAPANDFALTFSAICSFAGFVIGIAAAIQREAFFAKELTNWDSTAFFYALGILASAI